MGWKTKSCQCGCGRVGRFSKYATQACKQRAYRQRKKAYIDTKAHTVSSMLIDIFGVEVMRPIFDDLNNISGDKNTTHIDNALEKLIYATQHEINKAKKARRVQL